MCWTKIEIHQGTNEWKLDCRIEGNQEIDGWILRRINGIAVEPSTLIEFKMVGI